MDRQVKRTIQTLENILHACVIDYGGSQIKHLQLLEFSYTYSYHTSIGKAPFKVLYIGGVDLLLVGSKMVRRIFLVQIWSIMLWKR